MKRPLLYFKALWTSPAYPLLLAVCWGLSGFLPPIRDLSAVHALTFLIVASVGVWMFRARKVLWLNEFYLRLPAAREANALMTFSALTLVFLPLLIRVSGLSWLSMQYPLSLLLLALLAEGSFLSGLFLPLALISAFSVCPAYQTSGVILFGVPFLAVLALWVTRRLQAWQVRGFRLQPRYLLMGGGALLLFQWLVSVRQSDMRFVLSGEYIGFRNPDFEHPLFLTLFLTAAVLFVFLPFLNLLGFRSAEQALSSVRALRRTPCTRRLWGVLLGILWQLPLVPLFLGLRFVEVSPQSIWILLLMGVFVNTLWLTAEDSNWAGYAALLYLGLVHTFISANGLWLFFCALGLILLFYDMDMKKVLC